MILQFNRNDLRDKEVPVFGHDIKPEHLKEEAALAWACVGAAMFIELDERGHVMEKVPLPYPEDMCDCVHGKDEHDPITGSCMRVNLTYGPCPCKATPRGMREAQNVAVERIATMLKTTGGYP